MGLGPNVKETVGGWTQRSSASVTWGHTRHAILPLISLLHWIRNGRCFSSKCSKASIFHIFSPRILEVKCWKKVENQKFSRGDLTRRSSSSCQWLWRILKLKTSNLTKDLFASVLSGHLWPLLGLMVQVSGNLGHFLVWKTGILGWKMGILRHIMGNLD